MASNPLVLIFWLVCAAIGCLGAPYGIVTGNRYWGWGGGVFLLIAVLMLKFVYLSSRT